MALGDTYNNNNSNKRKNVNTYSLVNFANPEGVDKTKLSFDYWANMIKVSIAPLKEGGNSEYNSYDHDNAGNIYLTHIKARQLAAIIERYIKDPVTFPDNAGVNTKNSVIALHKTLNGSAAACLVIKVFNDSKQIESSYAYEFKNDFYFTMENFEDLETEYDKVFDNTSEIMSVYSLLMQFSDTINGALAHSVLEYGKFNNTKINSTLGSIAKKLGVEYNGYSNKSNTNVFEGTGNTKPGRTYSLDDIE